MFHKKSQMYSQVFVYVIAIIVFSLILIYGYNAIRGFKEKSEQITYIRFKTELTSTIERISPDYGTVKKEEFFIGGNYREICFVQSYKPPSDLADDISNPIIADSVKGEVNKNVFMFTDTLQESFDVGDINITGGYKCMSVVNGKIKVQFEGRGDNTFISTYSD